MRLARVLLPKLGAETYSPFKARLATPREARLQDGANRPLVRGHFP